MKSRRQFRDAGNFLLIALLYVGVLLALWATQA